MSDEEREANYTLIRDQVSVARSLVSITDRLLRSAEDALAHTAIRNDVYGDALSAIREAQKSHGKSIEQLELTEKAVLAFMKDKGEP